MGITSSGARCDVCGDFILDPEDTVHPFTVTGVARKLVCENKCKALLLAAKGDWYKLPNGPLRKAYAEAAPPPQRKPQKGAQG